MRLTLARFSLLSAQYLWNFTIFACSKCIKLSNTAFTFSWTQREHEKKKNDHIFRDNCAFQSVWSIFKFWNRYFKITRNVVTKAPIFNSFPPNVYAMAHFQRFEVFPLWDHDFIPDHLHPFLCVHGQVRSIYPRDIALIHLQGIITHI